jgi:S1-C subfamily serine protease
MNTAVGMIALSAVLASAVVGAQTPAGTAARTDQSAKDVAKDRAALEQRLAEARERLDKAARELAELSAQLGESVSDRLVFMRGGPPRRAMLGIYLDPESVKGGARIERVSPGGPAAEAGLRSGDVITAIAGEDLREASDPNRALVDRMAKIEPDQKVKLSVLRDGKTLDVEATARRAPGFERFAIPMPPPGEGPGEWFGDGSLRLPPFVGGAMEWLGGGVAGIELATLTPALGRYFGSDKGALVLRAPRGEAWKLEDGDVILAIDGRETDSADQATRILRSYRPGEKLSLRVLRQRKRLTLDVVMPERHAAEPGDRDRVREQRRVRIIEAD